MNMREIYCAEGSRLKAQGHCLQPPASSLQPAIALVLLLIVCPHFAEAAVSSADDKRIEVAVSNQGGTTTTSAQFRQQSAIGDAVAGHRISSSRFRLTPGFLGAALSGSQPAPVSDLDLSVLYAKTYPLGPQIPEKAWQRDADPIYIWEAPVGAANVAGYSYAFDTDPDTVIDTTATSLDVAASLFKVLADGKHTFTVKAVNSAGNAGKPVVLELWVDTLPPRLEQYTPAPGALLNQASPQVSATLIDEHSGLSAQTVSLALNGAAVSVQVDAATGIVRASGGTWKEGTNSLELRMADLIGNTQTPLIWSVVRDTTPPSGTVAINAGAAMTTSVYVTLGLAATDATSGVARLLLSNDELSGYVEEPFVAVRELWKLYPVRGPQQVFVKFVDQAGNISAVVADEIELGLLSPETIITSGPAGFTPLREVTFEFLCPEGDCVYAVAFDAEDWSAWSADTSATRIDLPFGNHYFRVKSAREMNGTPGIQPDEEDPSPAQRMWIIGVEPSSLVVPKGPAIKFWRIE